MEESKQIPEEKNSIESSSEIKKESNKEENVKAFTEFLEEASNQNIKEEKANSDLKEKNQNLKISLFLKEFSTMDLMEFHQILTIKCWHY